MTTKYNPFNERMKKQYEDALLHGAHKESRTVDAVWKAINLFEQFTGLRDFTTFNKDQAKGFKQWLEKQRNTQNEPLSLSTVCSTLANVREFFKWLATHPLCIRKVDGQAVMYLRLSNNDERAGRATRELPVPKIDEIRQVLEAMPNNSEIEKRDKAIVAFTALTGIRIDALISLKIGDVGIQAKEVWQNPRHVRTKNRKGITTFFMPFDPTWEKIVIDWINYAINDLGFTPSDPLFPKQLVLNNPEKMAFEAVGLSREHWAGTTPVREIFKEAFAHAALQYYHPHSFRKMLVIWAMENCSQLQVKALSQNIGHEHAMTTYNAYGKLNVHEQRKAIIAIGQGNPDLQSVPVEELLKEVGRRTQK